MENHELYLEFSKKKKKELYKTIDLQLETETDFLLKVNYCLTQENVQLILKNTKEYMTNNNSMYSRNSKIYFVLKDLLNSKNSKIIIQEENLEDTGIINVQEIFEKIKIQVSEADMLEFKKIKNTDLKDVAREIYIQKLLNLENKESIKETVRKMQSRIETFKVPQVYFKDVYGLEVLQELEQVVRNFTSGSLSGKRGFLIHGDSGVGKSALAFAMVNELSCNCIYVDAPRIRSKILGESESNILTVFNQAKACRPCVILVDQVIFLYLDKIDMILPMRGSNESSENTGDRITACFLAGKCILLKSLELDSSFAVENPLESIFIIGITNRIEAVDPSVYRHSRLDHLVHIPLPDLLARKFIFTGFLSKMPHDLSSSDIDNLAAATDGWTGADIENLLRETALRIIRKNHGIFNKDLHLASQDFDALLSRVAF
jgi:SpoVK/Ycf46/Vps4 family AAA+-type ATPase